MRQKRNSQHFYISEEAKMDMTLLFCRGACILADVFASFPLRLKRHCIQTGAVAGLMAEHAPAGEIPEGLTREQYANAARYGGFYHDIGAYHAYNDYGRYPAAGYKLLSEQLSEQTVPAPMRRVILETVRDSQERYDGGGNIPLHAGICAIASRLDMYLTPVFRFRRLKTPEEGMASIRKDVCRVFTPEAMRCFEAAKDQIFALYRQWIAKPPCWHFGDVKPLQRNYSQAIG